LLERSQPSVRYHTLVDLLGYQKDHPDARDAYAGIPRRGWAADILALQKPKGYFEPRGPKSVRAWLRFLQFPEYSSTIWRALVLSDLGLTSADPRIGKVAELIFEYKLQLGSPMNFFTEEPCIVGNTARMMTRFGYGDDLRIRKLYGWLLEDQKEDGGWNCIRVRNGTLDTWEPLAALAAVPKSKRSRKMAQSISRGVEFYLGRKLFEEGASRYEPWHRFHYPVHYFYDVLVGLDIVTGLGYADDRRLRPALALLESKRQSDGSWLLDRVHPDLAEGANEDLVGRAKKLRPFTLEEPGRPSKWITLTALRVLKRVEDEN
jgi:hypothetical protein